MRVFECGDTDFGLLLGYEIEELFLGVGWQGPFEEGECCITKRCKLNFNTSRELVDLDPLRVRSSAQSLNALIHLQFHSTKAQVLIKDILQ